MIETLNLPVFECLEDLNYLIQEGSVNWEKGHNQINISGVKGKTNDPYHGAGSTVYDWDATPQENGEWPEGIKLREEQLKEEDFTELNDVFVGTVFEDIFELLTCKYHMGRIRLMRMTPKTCLTWHTDITKRIHLPITTNEDCFMILDNEKHHIPAGEWSMVDTTIPHTAVNASLYNRVHIVGVVLGKNDEKI